MRTFVFAPYLFTILVLYVTIFLFSRAQAKRRKTGGYTTAPTAQEPETAKPDSPAPYVEPTEARKNASADAPQPSEPADDDMATPESPPKADPKPPSPSPAVEDTTHPEVVVTGTGYHSPEPHVLTKHTSKAETCSSEKLDFEFPMLEKLTADELHASYLNCLSTSRNMELKLVGLMKKKYEVLLFSCLSLYPYVAPKSWFSVANSRLGLPIFIILQIA